MASQKRKRARKKKRQLRSVFVLARPLTIADKLRISFVSDGKLPLCHWAMLVSKAKEADILDKIQTVRRDGKSGQLGTLFELVRHKNDNHAHMNQLFGPIELNTDWRLLTIGYVGVTELSDDVLEDHAHNITRLYPKYNGYKNNCQNFIRYLLECIRLERPAPLTIQNMVQRALTMFILPDGGGNASMIGFPVGDDISPPARARYRSTTDIFIPKNPADSSRILISSVENDTHMILVSVVFLWRDMNTTREAWRLPGRLCSLFMSKSIASKYAPDGLCLPLTTPERHGISL